MVPYPAHSAHMFTDCAIKNYQLFERKRGQNVKMSTFKFFIWWYSPFCVLTSRQLLTLIENFFRVCIDSKQDDKDPRSKIKREFFKMEPPYLPPPSPPPPPSLHSTHGHDNTFSSYYLIIPTRINLAKLVISLTFLADLNWAEISSSCLSWKRKVVPIENLWYIADRLFKECLDIRLMT